MNGSQKEFLFMIGPMTMKNYDISDYEMTISTRIKKPTTIRKMELVNSIKITTLFYAFLKDEFNLSKTWFFNNKSYFDFLSEYPIFELLSVELKSLRSKIRMLKDWFVSDECLALSANNICSAPFWTTTPQNIVHEMNDTRTITPQIIGTIRGGNSHYINKSLTKDSTTNTYYT